MRVIIVNIFKFLKLSLAHTKHSINVDYYSTPDPFLGSGEIVVRQTPSQP